MSFPSHRKRKARKAAQISFQQSLRAVSAVAVSYRPPGSGTQHTLKDLGLAIEPIVAYRAFGLGHDYEGCFLLSFNGEIWPGREPLRALCAGNILADHDVPSPSCSCGIYAWNRPEHVHHSMPGYVWGVVYLWGDVLIADLGYRAEFAYPKELHLGAANTRNAQWVKDSLAEVYGVPVTATPPPSPAEPVDVTLMGTTNPYFTTGATGPVTIPTFPSAPVIPSFIPSPPPPIPPIPPTPPSTSS